MEFNKLQIKPDKIKIEDLIERKISIECKENEITGVVNFFKGITRGLFYASSSYIKNCGKPAFISLEGKSYGRYKILINDICDTTMYVNWSNIKKISVNSK